MKHLRTIVILSVLLTISTPAVGAEGGIVTMDHTYRHDGVELRGYLAKPENLESDRPGVLVVHQWKGLTDYERRRSRMLAELGYVAFAADIYGADTRPANNHEASLASKTFREDRGKYRKRLDAALRELRSVDGVDAERIGAIGYCFGGTGVLELARSGADVEAVASFHGGLKNPNPDDVTNIRSIVQVHHGARDPYVSQEDVNSFWNEMKSSDAEWELHVYSGAVHSFTQRDAGDDPSSGNAYNARADRLSWEAMKRLFRDTLE